MDKRNEFKNMLDQILIEIIKETAVDRKGALPVLTNNVINMLRNLNQQIADQKLRIDKLETELQEMEKRFKMQLRDGRKKLY
ncbi:MAG: hypothetical protein HZA15_12905 [Nitrospirae bacterium]|nr:hypothetical protein [Nitrospirota bacterium]